MSFFRKTTDPVYIPPGGPNASPPPPKIYESMGDENIYKLLSDFYQQLSASEIAEMFKGDMDASSRRSAMFFIGLLGGPPLYHQQVGPPRMRMRHLPFVIDERSRQVWLACFFTVLEKYQNYGIPENAVDGFKRFLEGFSAWMVNTD